MPNYYIEAPIVVRLMVEVKAESKEEALNKLYADTPLSLDYPDEQFEYVDAEWELYDKVVEGNVYHGMINELHIEEVEGEEDE